MVCRQIPKVFCQSVQPKMTALTGLFEQHGGQKSHNKTSSSQHFSPCQLFNYLIFIKKIEKIFFFMNPHSVFT
jgi:hypothetical protein